MKISSLFIKYKSNNTEVIYDLADLRCSRGSLLPQMNLSQNAYRGDKVWFDLITNGELSCSSADFGRRKICREEMFWTSVGSTKEQE